MNPPVTKQELVKVAVFFVAGQVVGLILARYLFH